MTTNQSYAAWFEDRRRWTGFRNGIHSARVFVKIGQYDHYLTLDAADSLLCQESHPKAIEAREYLREVARERAGVIEGEARRVGEEYPAKFPALFRFETKQLRTEPEETGDPVFHANDLCGLLGYVNPRDALKKHVEKEDVVKLKVRCDVAERDITSNGPKNRARKTQMVNFVREPGLWALLLGSEAPNAKKIKRWVTTEVLPALYRTGRFDMRDAPINPTPADTPPHQPLIIPFQAGPKEIPVRVAIRAGRPWFLAFDVALIVDEPSDDPRPAFAGVPEAYKELRPTPDGESAALWLDEAGLAWRT